MNAKMKRRMVAVTGIIVIVLVLLLAFVGGNAAAKTVSVAEAAKGNLGDQKIQVTGTVVDNSFTIRGDTLTFAVYDSELDPKKDADADARLSVRYDGGVAATFGNGVMAICTGKLDGAGVLVCSELVTQCPSKYESAKNALTISDLLGYGESVIDKPVKVTGIVALGTLASVDAPERFVLKEVEPVDSNDETALHVKYAGALPDKMEEGSQVVLTGSIGADRMFTATDVALEG